MLDAQVAKPTAAKMDATLAFTTDGYSDADGVDHVTAAAKAIAVAERMAGDWSTVSGIYTDALAASDRATSLEMTAKNDDLVVAHQPIHDAMLAARAKMMTTAAPHWAAIEIKADAFLRMWGDDETSRYAQAAKSLVAMCVRIGDTPLTSADAVTVMEARGHAERLCYFLAHDADGYQNWACSVGGVSRIAAEAESIARESRALAEATALQWALSGEVISAVWFSKRAKVECAVEALSDEWSTAIRTQQRLDAKPNRTEREQADLLAAEARLSDLNDEVFEHIPRTRAGMAFQLLVAAGRVPHVRGAVTDAAKADAERNVVQAITNSIRVLGLPFDYRAGPYFVGPHLDDLDGCDVGERAK